MSRRLAHTLVWIVVFSAVAGACSNAESTRTKSEGALSSAVEDSTSVRSDLPRRRGGSGPPSDVVANLIRKALQSDGSVSHRTLVQQLGTPQRVETEPVANQYVRTQIDTLRTLIYGGIEALIYDVANESKAFLVRLSLSEARYMTPEGLRVGLTKQRVIDILGPPTRHNSSEGELIYQETPPKPTSMLIHMRNDRVTRIDWEFNFA